MPRVGVRIQLIIVGMVSWGETHGSSFSHQPSIVHQPQQNIRFKGLNSNRFDTYQAVNYKMNRNSTATAAAAEDSMKPSDRSPSNSAVQRASRGSRQPFLGASSAALEVFSLLCALTGYQLHQGNAHCQRISLAADGSTKPQPQLCGTVRHRQLQLSLELSASSRVHETNPFRLTIIATTQP